MLPPGTARLTAGKRQDTLASPGEEDFGVGKGRTNPLKQAL